MPAVASLNLRKALSRDDTVLFVGSGISRWSGLPSWEGLIEELAIFLEEAGVNADLVRAEAKRGDLLQAASYGFFKLTNQQVGEFIRGTCRYGKATPHEIHHKLVTLGPRCFVTTNYDNLLEESLRKWKPDRFYGTAKTNKHLTELSDIVYTRARDFVYKPHGDAGDAESIVLTREQYRKLLPDGERHRALDAVKTLMLSRPVVYVGFGLRDPDFIYLRDLLANTYQGGIRDHYAIMADVTETEVDYWRTQYGIHLIGYSTVERPDKSRDHQQLLGLLNQLSSSDTANATPVKVPDVDLSCPTETILALARHAARLLQAPKCVPEYPIRTSLERERAFNPDHDFALYTFDDCPVETFLSGGPFRAILIGAPGAGKSYSMQQSAAGMAKRLKTCCLSVEFDSTAVTVPLLVDLKLYRGNLVELIDQTLPSGLSFAEITKRWNARILLDSFNEIPKEYWDNGTYESDFARFLVDNLKSSFVIASRTTDGLTKLRLPIFRLDQIDSAFVEAELGRLGIELTGRFQSEMRHLLQKPLFFQLAASGSLSLPENAQPKDFYEQYFKKLDSQFRVRFGADFAIEPPLAKAAFQAINLGEEAQPLVNLTDNLQAALDHAGQRNVKASEIANWLVSKEVVIPHRGARVAFFHQSITEYLAASELARQYRINPEVLEDKLSLTRWDQALFLTLSMLSPSEGRDFLGKVIEVDLSLALTAAKYLDSGRDEVVKTILSQVPSKAQRSEFGGHGISSAIESNLAISEAHEPELRAIMQQGGLIGAAAVIRLVQLKGPGIKKEILRDLFDHRDDYNYCVSGIGRALQGLCGIEEAAELVALAESGSEDDSDPDDDEVDGCLAGIAKLISHLGVAIIRENLLPADLSISVSKARLTILCSYLDDQQTEEALGLAAELLLRGVRGASVPISFILDHSGDRQKWSCGVLSEEHIQRLISELDRSEGRDDWSLRALSSICAARKDLAEIVKCHALTTIGILKAALLWCVSPEAPSGIFEAFTELTTMSADERIREPIHLIAEMDFDWVGHETLLLQLLRLRETRLTQLLLGTSVPGRKIGRFAIGPIEWWLNWMQEERRESPWFILQMSWLIGQVIAEEDRQAFLAEFNREDSRYRSILACSILTQFSELTTDALSESAISFLLAGLNLSEGVRSFPEHLLASASTERFASERLLPLLSDDDPIFSENLRTVLDQAGRRHGRRYIRA